MHRSIRTLALLPAAGLLLAACGSGSSATSSAQSREAEISAATHPSATSTAPAGPTIDPTGVDVCGLLSAADANSVAHAEELDGFQTASTVYSFTATKYTVAGGAGCTFSIKAPEGEDGQGQVLFQVRSAKDFQVPPGAKLITGLGNEAYDTGSSPVVREGTVTIEASENSFSDALTVALLRKMVPRLK